MIEIFKMWFTTFLLVLWLAMVSVSGQDQTPSWAKDFPRLDSCVMEPAEKTEAKCPNNEHTKTNWGPFDFGDFENNIISFQDEGKSIGVICTATYPLKVFVDFPEDKVGVSGQLFERQGAQGSAKYTRKLILESKGGGSGYYMEATVRCEKHDNSSIYTELFVNNYNEDDSTSGIIPRRLPRNGLSPANNIFVPKKLSGCTHIVPCKASKFFVEFRAYLSLLRLSLEDFRPEQETSDYNSSSLDHLDLYDPRIGQLTEICGNNFESEYNCPLAADSGTAPFKTMEIVDKDLQIEKENSSTSNNLDAICFSGSDPEADQDLTIWHRECSHNSLSLCETSISRNLDFGIGDWKPLRYAEAGNPSYRSKLSGKINKESGKSVQGAIMCFYQAGESNGATQIDLAISYYFTGADGELYLIPSIAANYSEILPQAALMVVTPPSPDPNTVGLRLASCKVAPFLLSDNPENIQIRLKLKDGKEVILRNKSAEPNVSATNGKNTGTVTSVIPAYIKAEAIEIVHCSADFLHSFEEFGVDQDAFAPPLQGPIDLTIPLGALGIIIILVVALVVTLLKYRLAKRIIIALTESELDEFFKGNPNQTVAHKGDGINVDTLPFASNYIILEQDLFMDNARVLGEGHFGKAIRGVFNELEVAIKLVKPGADGDYFREFLKELKIMAYLEGNPNVIDFYGAVVDKIKEGVCFAVLELSPFGDLLGYIQQHQKSFDDLDELKDYPVRLNNYSESYTNTGRINSLDLISFAVQIAHGMEYVAMKNVIHGDLAARNALVFPHNLIKITDFGLSRKMYGQDYTKAKEAPLPWRWLAIESLRYMRFSSRSDVWAFGVTIWEVLSLGQVPFVDKNWTVEFVDDLEFSNLRLSKPRYCPEEIFQVMLTTWQNDPDQRPTFTFLKGYFKSFYANKKAELINRGSTHPYLFFQEASKHVNVPDNPTFGSESKLTQQSEKEGRAEPRYQSEPTGALRAQPSGPEPRYVIKPS